MAIVKQTDLNNSIFDALAKLRNAIDDGDDKKIQNEKEYSKLVIDAVKTANTVNLTILQVIDMQKGEKTINQGYFPESLQIEQSNPNLKRVE